MREKEIIELIEDLEIKLKTCFNPKFKNSRAKAEGIIQGLKIAIGK